MVEKRSNEKRFPFTKTAIEKLPYPARGRVVYHDAGCDNLTLVASPVSKVFQRSGRVLGRPTRRALGKFPDLTVENARKACRRDSVAVADGKDPAAERHARRTEPTLAALWECYLETHARPRKRTWKDDERMYRKYMAAMHGKRLSALTQAVVAKWHGGIAHNHGPIQANRCKFLLATMFSKASAAVGYTGPNPCKGVPNFPERSRERFLLPTEMKAFFDALVDAGDPWHDLFQLALFTGARRGNIASMEWREIDLANGVWHISGSKTKNKRPTSIALCPPAVAILQSRLELSNGSPYVFPTGSASGHVIDPRKAWERVRETSGLTDLRMHDLRRSLGSWQAAAGASLAVIGGSLGHADLKSTQVYSRLQLDTIRKSVNGATSAMLAAGGVKLLEGHSEPVEKGNSDE